MKWIHLIVDHHAVGGRRQCVPEGSEYGSKNINELLKDPYDTRERVESYEPFPKGPFPSILHL